MRDYQQANTFTVSVAGMEWTMLRRSTHTVLEIEGLRGVLTLVRAAQIAARQDDKDARDKAVDDLDEHFEEYAASVKKTLEHVLVLPSLQGGEHGVGWDDVKGCSDALFQAWLGSAAEVDPTPGSSQG